MSWTNCLFHSFCGTFRDYNLQKSNFVALICVFCVCNWIDILFFQHLRLVYRVNRWLSLLRPLSWTNYNFRVFSQHLAWVDCAGKRRILKTRKQYARYKIDAPNFRKVVLTHVVNTVTWKGHRLLFSFATSFFNGDFVFQSATSFFPFATPFFLFATSFLSATSF